MKNKKTIPIIIAILLIIATIIAITITVLSTKNTKTNVSSEDHIKTAEEKNQEEIEKLKDMGEINRMQFYVSKYISYLEAGDYKNAYDLLYGEFKQNYFKTQEDFEEYVQDKYPEIITLDYENLQRLGTYYVLTVNFSDLIDDEKNFTQLFVVKENGYNDFVLSFQAE